MSNDTENQKSQNPKGQTKPHPSMTSTNVKSNPTTTINSTVKPPTKIHPTATISEKAILSGAHNITIGAHTVLHPQCRIVAENGPVTIGEGVIIWEKVVIGVFDSSDDSDDDDGDFGIGERQGGEKSETDEKDQREGDDFEQITIGKDVVIESGAIVSACCIGEGSIIEAYAKVEKGVTLGKYCKINSFISIPKNSKVQDYTVFYGENETRIDQTMKNNPLIHDIKASSHRKHLKTLQVLIPSNIAKWT